MMPVLLGSMLAAACSPSKPKDASKQSQAEHDLGVDMLSKGSFRSALTHAKKAVDLDPDNADAQLLAATVYVAFCAYSPDECHLAEAERHARVALKTKPDFREARNTLGSILVNERKYDEAIATLRPLTEDILYATPEIAWGNLGWAHLEKGDLDAGINALKRGLALQPAFCWGANKLGLAYERKGDLSAAEAAFNQAIETDRPQCKQFAEPYEGRARVRERLGDKPGAKADLEKCKALGEGSVVAKRCGATLTTMGAN